MHTFLNTCERGELVGGPRQGRAPALGARDSLPTRDALREQPYQPPSYRLRHERGSLNSLFLPKANNKT